MRRLRPRDRVFLSVLLVLFSGVLLLHVRELMRGTPAWIPLVVEGAPDQTAHPRVLDTWSGAPAGGVRAGDELLSVGERALRGAGRLELVTRVYQAAERATSVAARVRREGAERDTVLELAPIPYPWRKTLMGLALVLLGAAAFTRTRGNPPGRLFFLAALAYALNWMDFFSPDPTQTSLAILSFGIGSTLIAPLTLRLILSFPEEVARPGLAPRIWPWAFAVLGLAITTWAFSVPLPPRLGRALVFPATLAFVATALLELTVSYRRASPAGRRQLKWVLMGFYLGLAPAGAAALLGWLEPGLWWVYQAALATAIAIPIGLFIALVRFNLFDIDRLITATASYSFVSVAVIGALVLGAPRLANALDGVVSTEITTRTLALALVAAGLIAHRALEPRLGRWLHPERAALELGAQQLGRELASCEKPEDLLVSLGTRLHELTQASCIAIYGRSEPASFAPVFARGRAIAPAFEADGTLALALEGGSGPLDALRIGRRGAPGLAPGERAALEAMGVELILPIVPQQELAAFACRGEKGSGDVFTRTDRALLQSVADRAAAALRAFAQAELYREQRRMSERLRSYVPDAVAERLASGGELEEGAREVSVLFVDIRGYTALSERSTPEAIHALVSGYTSVVSRAVRAHGGAVVEFNGDGLMAVFGALGPSVGKERAALAAAREMVAQVRALELRDAQGEPVALDLGVGIATGEAYVGSVRAVDRRIWSALGNTTNLAARLQTLTKELDAWIAVDASTAQAAGEDARDLAPHPARWIRGRSERIDVFTLPRAGSAALKEA